MAHAETLGFGDCPSCGGAVAWKLNRSELAYCRCDHCGAETRHHWHKSSDKIKAKFAAPPAPTKRAAEPVPEPEKRPTPAPVPKKSPLSTLLG